MRSIALGLAATTLLTAAATADGQQQGVSLDNCSKSWALAASQVSGLANPTDHPAADALDDTAGTFVALAPGGCITLTYGGTFTQDGTPFSDVGIDIVDFNDCYEIALRPANGATKVLLTNAGWEAVGAGFYRPFGVIECGDQNWDIDFYAPGNGPGSLVFDALRICVEDDAPGDVEVARSWANLVCPCPGPTATMVSKPCGFGPLDPVMTAEPFELFTAPKIFVDSQFPNVPGWFYISAPAQQALNVGGCDFWLTPIGLGITKTFTTDANGDYVDQGPLLGPSFAGIEFVLQARVCAPGSGFVGPFAPFPDFFSNSLIIRVGCPASENPTGN